MVENQELLAQVNDVFKQQNAKQVARDKGFKNLFRNAPNIILVCTPAKGGGEIDAGMLGQNIMLAAQSIGLGTCCLGGIVRFIQSDPKTEFFREALGIPIDYKINYILALSHAIPARLCSSTNNSDYWLQAQPLITYSAI